MSEMIHEHVIVDEETYFGLLHVHQEVQRLLEAGELKDSGLEYLSTEAERRLVQSRARNAADPDHHTKTCEL